MGTLKQKMYGTLTTEDPNNPGKYIQTGENVSLCEDKEENRIVVFVNKGDIRKSAILNKAKTPEEREQDRKFYSLDPKQKKKVIEYMEQVVN